MNYESTQTQTQHPFSNNGKEKSFFKNFVLHNGSTHLHKNN